jgi:oxygen-independent coproporphyrinogen-3 oxidase
MLRVMTSLYIHIPFCQKKCFYCSFAVCVARQNKADLYLNNLAHEAKWYKNKEVETLYVGGGTPSLLNIDQIKELIGMIFSTFRCNRDAEFTFEANPEDIDEKKAKVLFELGVNRVSLGVQSFDDATLKFLGRCHTRRKAKSAFEILRGVGFANINLDLIFDLPGQTQKEIRKDIEDLVKLKSEHVSIYALSVEPNSRFCVQRIKERKGKAQAGHYQFVVDFLKAHGLFQYEISNFATPSKESRHNMNYWQGGNYIGLGVAAHSHHEGRRSWNVSRLKEYMARIHDGQSPTESFEELSSVQRFLEAFLFGLRMNQGVSLKEFENKFSCGLDDERQAQVDDFIKAGLLTRQEDTIRTTSAGRLVLDEMSARLI